MHAPLTSFARTRQEVAIQTIRDSGSGMLADLLADAWRENVQGKSIEELEAMKRGLHRQEQEVDARVDVWQMDDLCGVAPESENAVDDAILSQIARLLELYTVRQEIRTVRREG